MTLIGRLVGCFSALALTLSILSCADGTKPSPLAPTQTAVVAPAGAAVEAGEVDIAEATALLDGISDQATTTCTVKGNATVGAKVTVTCGAKSVYTVASKGTFEIKNLPLKQCTVKFEHTDYTAPSKTANCVRGGTVTVKLTLTKKKTTVPPKPQGVPCSKCRANRANDGAACQSAWEATRDADAYNACVYNMLVAYNACTNGPPARCVE